MEAPIERRRRALLRCNTEWLRVGLILDWSQGRGRVSSTEAADLTGFSRASTAKLLTRLAEEGQLEDGRPNRTGRGFFYTPASHPAQ